VHGQELLIHLVHIFCIGSAKVKTSMPQNLLPVTYGNVLNAVNFTEGFGAILAIQERAFLPSDSPGTTQE